MVPAPTKCFQNEGGWGAGSLAGVRIGVLASGEGTVLQAILDAGIDVAVVILDRPCEAEFRAKSMGVAAELVERESFGPDFDRDAYTNRVVESLERHQVDVVAMAGYGTILGQAIHDAYPGRILNTHPALLPAFKGWHAVRDALAAGVDTTGCTVHIATLGVDEGPILAQAAVAILPDDTEATLHDRIKAVEHVLYPATIKEFLSR